MYAVYCASHWHEIWKVLFSWQIHFSKKLCQDKFLTKWSCQEGNLSSFSAHLEEQLLWMSIHIHDMTLLLTLTTSVFVFHALVSQWLPKLRTGLCAITTWPNRRLMAFMLIYYRASHSQLASFSSTVREWLEYLHMYLKCWQDKKFLLSSRKLSQRGNGYFSCFIYWPKHRNVSTGHYSV